MNVLETLRETKDLLVHDAMARDMDTRSPAICNIEALITHFEADATCVTLTFSNRATVTFTPDDLAVEPSTVDRVAWVRWFRDRTGESMTVCLLALSYRESSGSLRGCIGRL